MKKSFFAAVMVLTLGLTTGVSTPVYADETNDVISLTDGVVSDETAGTTEASGIAGAEDVTDTEDADTSVTDTLEADTSNTDTSDTDTSDTGTSGDAYDETVARPQIGSGGNITIAIDAGHGGSDNGASANGLVEKEINLKLAQYVVEYLSTYDGITVYMTRASDVYVGLEQRVEMATTAGADLFISLHNNSASSASTVGTEIYYPNANFNKKLNTIGIGLSSSILRELTKLGLYDRGIKTRNSSAGTVYSDGSVADYYSVIRNAKRVGICGIIVEHAFLTGTSDAKFLSSEANIRAAAMADVQGIVNYLSLEPEASQTPNLTIQSPGTGIVNLSWDEVATAKGYLVYRSTKSNKGFKKVGKLTGSSDTFWSDLEVPVGTSYYYKVRSYRYIDGYYIYSDYSDVLEGHTIGGTKIQRALQKDNYLKLWWDETPDADGYQLQRKVSGQGSYEVVANVAGKTSYADRTVEPDLNYVYKVIPLNILSGSEGYGTESKVFRVSYLAAPNIKVIKFKSKGRIGLSWFETTGAGGYEVYRSEMEDGDYTLVATTASDKRSFVDSGVEVGKTYYYKIKAIRTANSKYQIDGDSEPGVPVGFKNFDTPVLYTAETSTETDGVYLQWKNVDGADEYRIYRSTDPTSGFTTVKKIKPAEGEVSDYTDVFDSEPGEVYYYKIKAGRTTSDGQYVVSEASNVESTITGYSIMGVSRTDVDQMVNFYINRGGDYPELYADYGASTIEEFAAIVYEEAEAEGVRAEVVFGQVCKETGFLRFGGDVSPEQCNFAGIGATGGGVKGAAFPDVRTGIRAQVQHLKAYASDAELVNEVVDPRFDKVTRGTCIYVEWLGISENPYGAGWATAIGYGYSLRDDYIKPMLAT